MDSAHTSIAQLAALAQAAALGRESWDLFARHLERRLGALVWLGGVPGVGGPTKGAPPVRFWKPSAPDPCFAHLVEVARGLAPGEVRRADELPAFDTPMRLATESRPTAVSKLGSIRSLVLRIGGREPPALLLALWPLGTRSRLGWGKQQLSLLAGPLAQALETAMRLEDLGALYSALRAVVDWLPVGVFLLEPCGRPLLTNAAADSLLREGDGLRVTSEGLRGATCEGTAEIQGLLEQSALHGSGGGEAATLLPRASGRAPLHAMATSLQSGGRSVVALLIRDPERVPELRSDLLQRFYDLTPAEAALARVLAQGHDLQEAAEALGITRHTVRSRLRDLFTKTGTSRQAALVERLLANIPAIDAIH